MFDIDNQNVARFGILANGIFAGLGLAVSLSSAKVLRVVPDPLTAWATTFKTAGSLAVPSVLLSSAAHFFLYYRTKDTRSLVAGLLSLVSMPYTLIFMQPTNDKLLEIFNNTTTVRDKVQTNQLVQKWINLQWFRCIAGSTAFIYAIISYL
ncbi:hypothetical protein BCR43DRAFT_489198 [Syncephalastrum racemosum]|uniref:DUF1772-domain-containing protein n=1 Tax=Syncephalastrum racemosum TaxID=13706 RepID=A0A1X2HK10_SYNRA|nr:hypothetical protein BCR43DRAFT_489198 [Syncephalastrum racemosum]